MTAAPGVSFRFLDRTVLVSDLGAQAHVTEHASAASPREAWLRPVRDVASRVRCVASSG